MGSEQSQPQAAFFVQQISREEMNLLLGQTHYTEPEIEQLYAQFATEAPSGVVPGSTFNIVAMSLGIQDPVLCNLIFNAFDSNGDGMISFHEFIRGMSTMTRGTNEEKVQFAFRMYDLHRVGYLTRETVLPIVESLNLGFGPLKPYPSTQHHQSQVSVVTVVNEMLKHSDNTGRLTYAQFREYCYNNSAVMKGLGLG